MDSWFDWCVENGFEFIDMALPNTSDHEENVQYGNNCLFVFSVENDMFNAKY